ncbi:MAG: gamma-glutamyltransferase family protein [Parvularcula sp.]|jgi:gamma-glutamyltranspeptidase/glutathione hydrolase|nr:gamma-glutamyltransferase family protein [Parvularcula sp.]
MRGRDWLAFLAALGMGLSGCGQDELSANTASTVSEDEPVVVPFIISTAHPLATEAGRAVLADGGSAVDAAIAVQAVLGLVEPQSSGLAGGAFLLFYDAEADNVIAYDGREIAPRSAHPEIFLQADGTPMPFIEAVQSGFATGVPGVVAMLELAHGEHGKRPWKDLFSEAERLATDGFPMPVRMNQYVSRLASLRGEDGAQVYFAPSGAPKKVGDVITHPAYAETLRMIAEGGADAYYNGAIAEAIIERVNRKTGAETLTRADFESYEPAIREPLCAEAFAHRICTMPPPSAGGTMLLQIVQMFEMTAGQVAPREHLVPYIEASRLAYADRMRFLGDPNGMGSDNLAAEELIRALVDARYLEDRARLIGNIPAADVGPGNPVFDASAERFADDQTYEQPSTSHFSIRDRYGNVAAMTTTVEFPFGSGLFAAGMALNNQLTDFSRVPGTEEQPVPNTVQPGHRPASSMTPLIAFNLNGSAVIALGSPGGTAIPGYVALPLLEHLAGREALSEAVRKPHIVAPRGEVIVEDGADELARAIGTLGYEVASRELTSGLYGFSVKSGEIDLVVDPRREGNAVSGD